MSDVSDRCVMKLMCECYVTHSINIGHVCLIPDKDAVHINICILLNLQYPVDHVIEAVQVRHVVHQQDTVRAAVVRSVNAPEPFLPGSVPYLQLHLEVVDSHGLEFEVDPDGGDEGGGEGIIGVPDKQGRLAHA